MLLIKEKNKKLIIKKDFDYKEYLKLKERNNTKVLIYEENCNKGKENNLLLKDKNIILYASDCELERFKALTKDMFLDQEDLILAYKELYCAKEV